MNGDRSLESVGVLDGIMAVVPGASILRGLEAIDERISRSNWTLRHTVNTIHVHAE